MKLNCKQCGKEIHKTPSQVKAGEGKFCSRSCYHESMKGVDLFTNEIRGRKSRVRVHIDCVVCGKAFETVPSKIGVRKYCSDKCYQKEHSAKIKNLRYIRDTQTYKEWRISVYKRDRFTCQSCGVVGNGLNAHHIIPVVVDIEKIFDINNGITLCKECHKLVHKSYKPKSKQGKLLERLIEKISSQARRGRLEGSQTNAHGPDRAMKRHECPASKDDDIVGAV